MLFSTVLIAASMMMSDTLAFSSVTAEKGLTVSREDTVSLKGCLRAEDALMRIPGLLINDMGGPSGLKTVSLRGMGTAQTAIYIDGVRVGNLMSGQTDLSMFCLGNYSTAIVDYAQNSISFASAFPDFTGGRNYTAKAAFTGGSFGTYMPSISFGYHISDKVTASLNTAGVLSKGYREHSGIEHLTGEIDFRGHVKGGWWKAKGYINVSDRECPGAMTAPWLSKQKDLNGFAQGSCHMRFGEFYTLNASVKAALDNMKYKDYYADDHYLQTEVQLNTSHIFNLADWCNLSASVSGRWNGLKSDKYIMDEADMISRTGITAASGASFRTERMKADISAEYAGTFDLMGGRTEVRHCFSPAVSLRFKAFEGLDIVAFGRRAYHIPTFNDLYYISSGNPSLRPEDTWLTDLGVEWRHQIGKAWLITAKSDGFFNYLTDKITWAPDASGLWLPFNIGKVRSVGADTHISASYSRGDWEADLSARYSFQDARDRTSDSYTFDSQISYVARHTVVLCADTRYRGWGFSATWNYRGGRKDSTGDMPAWNTLDMKASKTVRIKDICELILHLNAQNVTNHRYEISTGYPMPGRGLYGGVTIRL